MESTRRGRLPIHRGGPVPRPVSAEEEDVYRGLLAAGKSYRAVARHFGRSDTTIRYHVDKQVEVEDAARGAEWNARNPTLHAAAQRRVYWRKRNGDS